MWSWFDLNYYDNPLLKHRETFGELVDKLGITSVFAGTEVDTATQTKLRDYFEMDRLCAKESRFLWLFRRRLAAYYPMYKDSLAMWTERKAKEWFFDNWKEETATHDGTGNLTENATSELNRVLDRVFKGIHSGTTSDTMAETGTNTEDYTENRTGESNAHGTSSGKNRGFAFRYPESNYQGGVIPYDLNNNPDVEFLDSQTDALDKGETTANSTDTGETTGNRNGNTKTDRTANGKQDATDDQTTKDTGTDNQTADRKQDTKDHWQEERRRQGDNLNALVSDLINQIPQTDFFRQFTTQLAPCFQTAYLVDEIMEEDDRNEFV